MRLGLDPGEVQKIGQSVELRPAREGGQFGRHFGDVFGDIGLARFVSGNNSGPAPGRSRPSRSRRFATHIYSAG